MLILVAAVGDVKEGFQYAGLAGALLGVCGLAYMLSPRGTAQKRRPSDDE